MSREEGQTLGEYVLILMLVVIVTIVAVSLIGGQLVNLFTRMVNAL
jgi:Flp pilus assembly pilin Flp